ncbi:MAG TPA: cytochrome c biogenesis protein CcsA [Oligoflexia bacterium]|nr:cytochrome c biogenesis protein CcsA [Oligoflexia bacterium]HMP48824.1 cytochrome c biogenesis protein CcsA [Oligoflexia bacterium]
MSSQNSSYFSKIDRAIKLLGLSGKLVDLALPFLCLFFIPYALYHALILAPGEKVMGEVQRILYFHVGSAIASYVMLGVLFVSSVCYLVFRDMTFNALSQASASVSLLFSSIVLATGMLWGYSSWNTWWNWEPRLVSVLVLWVFLIMYSYIQGIKFTSGDQGKAVISSVIGILCAIQVPIVIFSIKLLDRTQQLHPEVVATQGLTEAGYKIALLFGNIAMILLSLWICRICYRRNMLLIKIRDIKRKSLIERFSSEDSKEK